MVKFVYNWYHITAYLIFVFPVYKTVRWYSRSVNSDLIPLGWFIKTAMAARYGSSWAHDSCDRWVANDRKDSAWRHDLWWCPCTLAQALSDFGRYQPDESCNVYHQTSNQCDRHRGAIHCVLSVWAKYVYISPDSKAHGANMGPTWVLSAPDGPHVGPMNLAIWVCMPMCMGIKYEQTS